MFIIIFFLLKIRIERDSTKQPIELVMLKEKKQKSIMKYGERGKILG